ncbi:hypothetical protein [Clostridium sp.]|uniref:hypothetical protein n=1 Tax=Clostridium sp. TaxID=1506 RepID=UPI001A56EAA2|nr:hypothetical protein [Clostridium sp.]MBK5242009.1 hypothetical protein [Clostridium sp.]
MKRVRSKFLTFCFSLLPGAGHMYMGFMKLGLSLMAAFFFLIFISTWLNIGPLLFFAPLIWFYSFFDCMNKRYSTDEEFSLLEDNYLFSLDEIVKIDIGIFKKHGKFTGIFLVILGGYLIWNNVIDSLARFMPGRVYAAIVSITRVAPQVIIGVAIIVVGLKLISGKRKECVIND